MILTYIRDIKCSANYGFIRMELENLHTVTKNKCEMQIKHHIAGGTNNWPYASMNSKNLDVDLSLTLGLRLSSCCYI